MISPVFVGGGLLLAILLLAGVARASGGSGCPAMPEPTAKMEIERVDIPNPVPGGLALWRLRSDVAAAARSVVSALEAVGARASSSGGTRALNASTSAGRVDASLHKLGCALDLWIYSAMEDPKTDPYIVTRDDARARLWRVWARCQAPHGEVRTLEAVRNGAPPIMVTARVVDLTAIMECHGLHRIPAWKESWDRVAETRSVHAGLEFWHFERRMPSGTTFGAELRRIYSDQGIAESPAAALVAYRWDGGRFVAPGSV